MQIKVYYFYHFGFIIYSKYDIHCNLIHLIYSTKIRFERLPIGRLWNDILYGSHIYIQDFDSNLNYLEEVRWL